MSVVCGLGYVELRLAIECHRAWLSGVCLVELGVSVGVVVRVEFAECAWLSGVSVMSLVGKCECE